MRTVALVIASFCAVMLLACSGAGSKVDGTKVVPPKQIVPSNEPVVSGKSDSTVEVGNDISHEESDESNMSESSGVQNKTLPLMLEDWSFQTESNFVTAIGRVTNMTDLPMENVQVVIQFFTSDGAFVKSGDALVEFNPILSGQTSPFTVIVSGNPEIATGTISFKTLFGGTIPSLSRAKVEEEQQQQIAEEDRKRREAQKERDAAEAVIRMELLQKEAPAAWQELHLELSDSLTPKSRDKLRSFVKEYKGTPEGVLAENESKADGMWTLVKQYERIKNKKKSTDLALEIIKDFPETVSAKQAKKWIEGAK